MQGRRAPSWPAYASPSAPSPPPTRHHSGDAAGDLGQGARGAWRGQRANRPDNPLAMFVPASLLRGIKQGREARRRCPGFATVVVSSSTMRSFIRLVSASATAQCRRLLAPRGSRRSSFSHTPDDLAEVALAPESSGILEISCDGGPGAKARQRAFSTSVR